MRKLIIVISLFLMSMLTLHAQEWQTDFKASQEQAVELDRNILLVFQGSDWCAPCIKLDREIWSTQTFQDYSKDHFIMLKADFPRRKQNRLSEAQQKSNEELAEKYNMQGIFPLVVMLDKEGQVLGETGYKKMNPEEYIELLTAFE